MKINWEQWSDLRGKLRNIGEDIFETRNKTIDINCKIDQILKNQQEEIFKAHDLVIIYDGVNDIKVYENGKDITKGIERLTLEAGRPPRIKYDKVITGEKD